MTCQFYPPGHPKCLNNYITLFYCVALPYRILQPAPYNIVMVILQKWSAFPFLYIVNFIKFERATYDADEDFNHYSEIRLVSTFPFPMDTEVTVSFSDISATGE